MGLSSFSLSNVLSKLVVHYSGMLYRGYVSLGRVVPIYQSLKYTLAWQQVNQYRDDLQTS